MFLEAAYHDPDGDPVASAAVSVPSFAVFEVTNSDVWISLQPSASDAGTYAASITFNDGAHETVSTFSITVPEDTLLGGSISIADLTTATPYPSSVTVSGMTGVVADVTVAINMFHHSYPADVDILLVGPTGQSVELMSDCAPANDRTFTFADTGATMGIGSTFGTYKPIDCSPGSDSYPAPASTSSLAETLSSFDGSSPNGTWSLFVVDDAGTDTGAIAS